MQQPSINHWSVPREWEGEACVIFGSGPSLSQSQIDYVRSKGVRSIAINRTIVKVPWADVHYFADLKFYNWINLEREYPDYADVRAVWNSFMGYQVTIAQQPTTALHLKRGFARGLSHDPETLCTGSCSGYQAINLAYLFGAKRIILLGYDHREVNGRFHHHPEHPSKSYGDIYTNMLEHYPFLAQAIEGRFSVFNCTPGTALHCFEKMDLKAAL